MLRRLSIGLGSFALVLSLTLFAHWLFERQTIMAALEGAEPPAPYRIVRDAYGVPSIYGATDPAVAFGVAYAHAEDDFETIQQRLAPIRGHAGAIFGQEGAKADWWGHLMMTRRTVATTMTRDLSPEAIAVAKAYAAGLNAYAADHPGEMLRHQMFPVRAEDVVGGFVMVSPMFYKLDDIVGDLVEGETEALDEAATERGSNAFAIAPSRMADGSTVLISNSHQPWEGPAAWWEARLASGEGWSMAGSTFPGVPFILMGYNEHLSWTNTVNRPDLTDLYRLEVDGSGRRYRLDGEWRELERERVWLRVRFGPLVLPVPQTMLRSVHGPVIKSGEDYIAMRYAGMGESKLFEQYYALNRAKSFTDWEKAMRMQAIPSTNFVYADKDGNIAYLYNARFPKRSSETDWSGVLPGDRSELIWESYEPFGRQPYYVNPRGGWLVNANNTPFLASDEADALDPADFEGLVGIETHLTNRILRATKLMRAHAGPFTDEALHAIKYDTGYDMNSPLGQLFRAMAEDTALEDADADAAALLKRWDWTLEGEGEADSLAALVLYDLYLGWRGWHEMRSHGTVLAEAAAHLRDNFGRLDPPLAELSRLRRGEEDLPLTGGPDALRALYWGFDEEDGRLYGLNGDGYIAYVKWDQDGRLSARTVYPFGAAMGRPGSEHYADQAALFAGEKMKEAPLPDWREASRLAGEAAQ